MKQTEKLPHRYTCTEVFLEPDFPLRVMPVAHPTSFLAHSHDFIELVCVRSGQGIHRVSRPESGAEYSCGIVYGDVFLLRPGEIHSFISCSGLNMYNILFMPEIISKNSEEIWTLPGLTVMSGKSLKLHMDSKVKTAFETHAMRLYNELTDRLPGYRISARSILLELLVMTGRLEAKCVSQKSTPSGTNSLYKQQLVNKAICIMETESTGNLSIASLAERLKISQSQLTRTFKAICSLTPSEYLVRIRLEKAKAMLENTDMTVDEIAFKNGFGDASYMSRNFRRLEGCTPGEYRNDICK